MLKCSGVKVDGVMGFCSCMDVSAAVAVTNVVLLTNSDKGLINTTGIAILGLDKKNSQSGDTPYIRPFIPSFVSAEWH